LGCVDRTIQDTAAGAKRIPQSRYYRQLDLDHGFEKQHPAKNADRRGGSPRSKKAQPNSLNDHAGFRHLLVTELNERKLLCARKRWGKRRARHLQYGCGSDVAGWRGAGGIVVPVVHDRRGSPGKHFRRRREIQFTVLKCAITLRRIEGDLQSIVPPINVKHSEQQNRTE
jgi:hypothetical protein